MFKIIYAMQKITITITFDMLSFSKIFKSKQFIDDKIIFDSKGKIKKVNYKRFIEHYIIK